MASKAPKSEEKTSVVPAEAVDSRLTRRKFLTRGGGALAVSAHEPDSLGPLRAELARWLFADGPPSLLQARKATPIVAQASAPRA